MKKLIVPGALIGMAALIGVAMIVDCVRLANTSQHRVELADQELQKHEQRLVKTLQGFPERTPEVEAAFAAYEAANRMRHAEYEKLVASFQQTMAGKMDATNPLNRKLMDDVTGAINRRRIAEKSYDEEMRGYQEFLNSWRGRAASFFSNADSLNK
jgi:hypothetical protein